MASAKDQSEDLKASIKSPLENPADVSDQPSTSEFSITNPFEHHATIDSLLYPSFSPSVFNMNTSTETEAQKTPNSFWNIDQIAVLKPIDIDLSTLHNQQDFVRLDPLTEHQAQQAIDRFFSDHIELPSPWSGERPHNHYLALISPSPAQMKKKANLMTPLTGRPGFSSSSAASSISSSSQIRVRRLQLTNGKNPPGSGKIKKDDDVFTRYQSERKESKNASTQTTLTLPKGFDLEAVLSQYYTFGQPSENQNDTLNNTSLRRKLFFPDGREVETHDRDGEINLNMLQHIDDLHGLEKFADSPVPLQKIQPASNNVTPITRGTHEISRTPSTCQSHFSSSPLVSGMGYEHRTPCSSNSGRPRFGSGVRRRKMLLGSSEDEEMLKIQLDVLDSPELSPVKVDIFEVKGQSCVKEDIGGASADIDDESMSFRVCDDNTTHKMMLESRNNCLGELIPAMESSRRQLDLDSPPLSPIEPIKRKSNDKKSSTKNQVNSTQSLAVPSLCPSPMLSPIPCKNTVKTKIPCTLNIQHKATSSLLSSTRPVVTPDYECRPAILDSEFEQNTSGCDQNLKPFQDYEKVQYLDGNRELEHNKENIFPSPAVCSSMLSNESQDEDVSMLLDHTSCHQDSCNDDIYMQAEKHSTSVLYCSQGFNSLNPVQTGSGWIQPVSSAEPSFQNPEIQSGNNSHASLALTDPCMETSPRKPMTSKSNVVGVMDVSVPPIQCHALDDTANLKNLTEYQGDSGYSTTQSHYQAV